MNHRVRYHVDAAAPLDYAMDRAKAPPDGPNAGKPLIVGTNMTGRTLNDLIAEFDAFLAVRPFAEARVAHYVIAPHKLDLGKLAGAHAVAAIERYLAYQGHASCPYVAIEHHDTSVPHWSVVTTCVDASGYLLATNWAGHAGKQILYAIEAEHGLVPTGLAPTAKSPNADEIAMDVRLAAQGSERLQVRSMVRARIDAAALPGRTMTAFAAALRTQGVSLRLRESGGQITGISYGLHVNGEVWGISGTTIGRAYTWHGLQRIKALAFDPKRDAVNTLLDPPPLRLESASGVTAEGGVLVASLQHPISLAPPAQLDGHQTGLAAPEHVPPGSEPIPMKSEMYGSPPRPIEANGQTGDRSASDVSVPDGQDGNSDIEGDFMQPLDASSAAVLEMLQQLERADELRREVAALDSIGRHRKDPGDLKLWLAHQLREHRSRALDVLGGLYQDRQRALDDIETTFDQLAREGSAPDRSIGVVIRRLQRDAAEFGALLMRSTWRGERPLRIDDPKVQQKVVEITSCLVPLLRARAVWTAEHSALRTTYEAHQESLSRARAAYRACGSETALLRTLIPALEALDPGVREALQMRYPAAAASVSKAGEANAKGRAMGR